jgi:uncharacterized lipoprotein YddW (UPF0748 family)
MDWRTWIKNKLIDEVVIQMYFTEKYFPKKVFGDVFYEAIKLTPKYQAPKKICGSLNSEPKLTTFRKQIAVGIEAGKNEQIPTPSKEIKRQVEAVRKSGLAGVSFFFYDTLWNQKLEKGESLKERKKVFKELFPTFVQRPQLPRL